MVYGLGLCLGFMFLLFFVYSLGFYLLLGFWDNGLGLGALNLG